MRTMLVPSKPATAGLLLIASALFIVCVQSEFAVRDEDPRAIKRHHEDENKFLIKREAEDDERAPEVATKKVINKGNRALKLSDKGTTTTTTHKPATKKGKKMQAHGKMTTNKPNKAASTPGTKQSSSTPSSKTSTTVPGKTSTAAPGKTSTAAPGKTSTAAPGAKQTSTTPAAGGKTSTSKSPAKRKKKIIKDEADESLGTVPPSILAKFRSLTSTTAKPKGSENGKKDEIKKTNQKWLQNQELVAIEHMIAGAYDWIKVLRQTKGRTLNRKTAGEFFKKLHEVVKLLRGDHKPSRLIAYYDQNKQQ